jgi:Family of unknown function (DUF5330)
MIRFALRLTFWGCLIVAVLPGARKSGVYNGDLGLETVVHAAQATLLDLTNFCARNGGVCQTGVAAFSEASATAKESLLSAYQGVRDQYNEPDRQTITSSIRPKKTAQP